ncbi:FAD-dependent oxidoreductase [Mesosutterella multiformis]|jgi:fumarate reductase flavoprotein subunit|uniref:FAD-dependent oxidoreductase n=1 Tax=Mesosutterella multiformis TaxID=2259133 RepID=UPI000E4CBACE|nr:flavocytochrome c [Mesosutterella multiformis]RGU76092.1 flavocytochrome c [Sutterella sp. AF15-45LB]RGU77248.1 flavocytochrome c [Sutterella sp. AF15-44LB]RHH09000.1 flavocytochrome c [Sutterella sp. AM18-8-1]GCB31380.1 flavocytochrome c [Mesosutterella multiformis]
MKKTILASMLAVMMATPAFAAESTDIVIIGSGGAGLSSAITATEKGAKVIVLEKMAYFGGNSNRSEGEMNAAGTKQQKAHGITDDTPERFAADTIRGGHGLNDPALVKALTENAASAEEWLLDLGAHFCHRMGRGGGQTRARGHGPCDGSPVGIEIMRVLGERADKDHIDMRLNNRVTKILMKNGKVSGVQVKTPKGMETINAKAVILATGGFGANHKMVEKYRPELKGFSTTNHPGATGDGIILAQQVGAGLTDIEQIQIHPTVIKKNGALISESMRARGGFLLNKNGKRFTNELLTRDVVSANELKQPGGIAYLVIDNSIYSKNKMAQNYTAEKLMTKCDTIADVAKLIGVDEKVVQASFDQYHKAFDNKKDDLFGRPEMLIRMDQAPYFVAEVTPGIHHTMGGVKIDPQAEVLTPEKKPIPGLFAAGEVTGGVHGGNRIGGNAVADIITFGRISANSALKYIGK